jgi:hypothetical protein
MKKVIEKLVKRAKRVKMPTLLRLSAAFTIIGLALMVWSMLQPTPLPVMLAMSVGQMFGTTAFVLYLISIVIDLRRVRRARRDSQRELERSA